ncbi:hypothetical protein JW935_13800 [candidate division KSB1 bacterium]|nr:hypothetical protein [candidate division KSB1 bacterium]
MDFFKKTHCLFNFVQDIQIRISISKGLDIRMFIAAESRIDRTNNTKTGLQRQGKVDLGIS